jgi:hypothetical protein
MSGAQPWADYQAPWEAAGAAAATTFVAFYHGGRGIRGRQECQSLAEAAKAARHLETTMPGRRRAMVYAIDHLRRSCHIPRSQWEHLT